MFSIFSQSKSIWLLILAIWLPNYIIWVVSGRSPYRLIHASAADIAEVSFRRSRAKCSWLVGLLFHQLTVRNPVGSKSFEFNFVNFTESTLYGIQYLRLGKLSSLYKNPVQKSRQLGGRKNGSVKCFLVPFIRSLQPVVWNSKRLTGIWRPP